MRSKGVVESRGLVSNVQRFSIHDGPGIRTTVFLKGCPLSCVFCHNPELQDYHPAIMTRNVLCVRCGKCAGVCPVGAITVGEQGRIIDWAKCNQCLQCAEVCPTGAITRVGNYMGVHEIIEEVIRDEPFYRNSGGGVTISGGEPLIQGNFTHDLLKAIKGRYLSTAVDTSGHVPWVTMERVLQFTDLLLYDIKHMDSLSHKKMTGVDNALILDNIHRASGKTRIWLRLPLIVGYNDSGENLHRLAQLAEEIGAEKVSILPYHEWGRGKYEAIGRKYALSFMEPPNSGQVARCLKIIEGSGISVTVDN